MGGFIDTRRLCENKYAHYNKGGRKYMQLIEPKAGKAKTQGFSKTPNTYVFF